MKAISLFLITTISCAAFAVGCGGDSDTGSSTGTATTTTTTTNDAPLVPMIGEQVERMGRPAVNTATNHTFDADDAAKGAAKDEWNKAAPENWGQFRDEIADNLGILDSLDATCGNQLLAGATATEDRYNGLASVLTEDRLWVNLSSTTCAAYLAVEANASGTLENNDCGGRRLSDDVIAVSFSILAAGDLTGSIDDTIDADPVKTGGEVFPYLAPPQ